jgi:hypothetical protein
MASADSRKLLCALLIRSFHFGRLDPLPVWMDEIPDTDSNDGKYVMQASFPPQMAMIYPVSPLAAVISKNTALLSRLSLLDSARVPTGRLNPPKVHSTVRQI